MLNHPSYYVNHGIEPYLQLYDEANFGWDKIFGTFYI